MRLAYHADNNEWRNVDTGTAIDLPAGPYGITDGQGWIGNDEGPVTYDDAVLACISARVLDVRLGVRPGTWRPAPFTGADHKTEDMPTIMSNLEALERLESGRA